MGILRSQGENVMFLVKKLIIGLAILVLFTSGCSATRSFISAADDGNIAKVQSMLDEKPWLANARDIDNVTAAALNAKGITDYRIGWTALHSAANKGHKDVASLLIAKGADVNATDERDYTPLNIAALNGRKEVAELLIANRALLNPVDVKGLSPLHYAASAGNLEIAKMLIDKGAQVNAQSRDYTQEAGWVTVSGTTVSARNVSSRRIIEGRTPLHLAARNGHKEIAELLIAKGANVNMRDNYGSTALHWAAANNNKPVAEALLSKGAEINARSNNGAIPLHTAAMWGNRDLAEFLVAKGAEINAKNAEGLTPLSVAIKNKRDEVANYLRKQGGIE
jgi:ankyrin repeat protein